MSLMRIGNGLAGGGLYRYNPPASVLQERITGTYGHSLWYSADPYRLVPRWTTAMVTAAADSKSFENSFTFDTIPGALPPNYDRQMPGVTETHTGGAYANWAAADADGYTDVISFVDNFNVGPIRAGMETDPRIAIPAASSVNMVQHFVNLFNGWETNSTLTPTYWIYEVWGDSGSMSIPRPLATDGTEAYAGGFADYRALTTTTHGHTQFFDDCLADVKSDLPAFADRIKMIPACRVLISTMELAALSGMGAGDWFEDDAPHGTDSCYCVVGAIVYSCLYEEAAPEPSFAGSAVHSTIQSNWASIASHINTQVNQ